VFETNEFVIFIDLYLYLYMYMVGARVNQRPIQRYYSATIALFITGLWARMGSGLLLHCCIWAFSVHSYNQIYCSLTLNGLVHNFR
jgi:hypothetical protein